jgi:uncharacterized protein YraI
METVGSVNTFARGSRERAIAELRGASGARMDRRRLLRLMGGLGAAALTAGVAKAIPAGAAASSGFRVTSALNLRTEPSLQSKVILVMPAGALVYELTGMSNGFINVEYKGTAGWAHSSYLESTNPGALPPITGTAVTNDSVNFRSGPSTGDSIIKVLSAGTAVETTDKVVDGFRNVRLNSTRGWIYDAFLGDKEVGIQPGQTVTTTSALNLREQPSTNSKVLLVMPQGAKAIAYAQSENGFRVIEYNGSAGWAYEAYLA